MKANGCILIMAFAALLGACERAPEVGPLHPQSVQYIQMAQDMLARHEFDAALMLADSAEVLTPNMPDASFVRGRILSELGQLDRADSSYRRVLEVNPDYPGVWHNLGNNAFRQHQYEEAIAHYQKEVEVHPAPMPLRGVGRAYVEMGEVEQALAAFTQATRLDPNYAPAYFNLALLHEDEGDFEDALAAAREASELQKDDYDFRYLMASLMVKNGLFDEAIPHLQQVAEHWPWHFASHYNLGQALARAGYAEESQTVLEKAEQLRAQDANITQLVNSLQTAPNDPMGHAALGSALRFAGRYEDATRAYKMAVFLDPANLDIQTNLANLYLLKGDTLACIEGYQAILRQDPGFVDVWLNLGVVQALSRNPQAAAQAWQQVLAIDPNNEQAKRYLARLGGGA